MDQAFISAPLLHQFLCLLRSAGSVTTSPSELSRAGRRQGVGVLAQSLGVSHGRDADISALPGAKRGRRQRAALLVVTAGSVRGMGTGAG